MSDYVDIADHEEGERIRIIAYHCLHYKQIVAFLVEDDAKADRYLAKLKAEFPTVNEIDRGVAEKGLLYVRVCDMKVTTPQ